jgi:hypothetical protein
MFVFICGGLSGCFFNKKIEDAMIVWSGSIESGMVATGVVADTGTMLTGTVVTGEVLSGVVTGSGASANLLNQLKENDKDFDPKKSEDAEIEDLMQFIEKTVNE